MHWQQLEERGSSVTNREGVLRSRGVAKETTQNTSNGHKCPDSAWTKLTAAAERGPVSTARERPRASPQAIRMWMNKAFGL